MVVIRYGMVLKEARKRILQLNKRPIVRDQLLRFVIGVAIGLYTGFAIMFAISSAEHQRMHNLLEQHGIEEHGH